MRTLAKTASTLLAIGLLAACAPGYHTAQPPLDPPSEPPEEIVQPIYFYPKYGQDWKEQDRDHYECYTWAKDQTGFDPSLPYLTPRQQVRVAAYPASGYDTLAGAFTGAVLGAAIGSPHDTGEGAVIGAIAGAALGAASDASRQERAAAVQDRYNRASDRRDRKLEQQAESYRRAMGACLEGRGYSVQ